MTIEPTSEFIPQITMGDRLRRIRRDLKLGQRDFSNEIGVKESTYNAWETGRNAVDRLDPWGHQIPTAA